MILSSAGFAAASLFPLFFPGMAFLVGGLHVDSERSQIDFRGFKDGVAKHFLNGHDVGSVLYQAAGEGMAEGVGRYMLADVGGFWSKP